MMQTKKDDGSIQQTPKLGSLNQSMATCPCHIRKSRTPSLNGGLRLSIDSVMQGSPLSVTPGNETMNTICKQ
jgi:hypothetical protein